MYLSINKGCVVESLMHKQSDLPRRCYLDRNGTFFFFFIPLFYFELYSYLSTCATLSGFILGLDAC